MAKSMNWENSLMEKKVDKAAMKKVAPKAKSVSDKSVATEKEKVIKSGADRTVPEIY